MSAFDPKRTSTLERRIALMMLLFAALVACSRGPKLDASTAEAFEQSHARVAASLSAEERERLRLLEVVFMVHCADPADVERAVVEQDQVRLLATAPCRRMLHGMTYTDILRRLNQRPEGLPLMPLLVAMCCVVAFARVMKSRIKRLQAGQLLLLLVVAIPLSSLMIITSANALRDDEITIETRSSPRATYDREREAVGFWFWTGVRYIAGIALLGFVCGATWNEVAQVRESRGRVRSG